MDFDLTDEQRQIQEAFGRFFQREATSERVRAAEPLGFDPDLAKQLWAMGGASMAVPEADGGGGATLFDVALVAEQLGRHAAPVPLVEAAVACRLLGTVGATGLLRSALDGAPLVTLAVRAGVDGWGGLVPAGAVADIVLGFDDDELVACDGPPRHPAAATLGTAPVADRALAGDAAGERRVLGVGDVAGAAYERAVREWRILTAASLVGLASAALDLALDYVKARRQFGVPIATFQTVAHRLADCATALDGARLLALSAAARTDTDDPRAPALADMAFAFAAETAQRVCAESLHFHGGYGFMVDYDVQLYFRRAKAWALVGGDPRRRYADVARHRHDRRPGDGDRFRSEARAFVAEHVTREVVGRAYRTGTMHDWGLHRALGRRGWVAGSWPGEEGGQGRSAFEMSVLMEELNRAGAPLDGWVVTMAAANAVRLKGSPELRGEVLPAIAAGEALIAIGFSEPDSGSDVAAARTTAVPDGDEWIVNGQKMFTTMAHEARWVFLLTRTNPDAPKHRGLTMFLVPLDSPGIEIQPVHTVGWERTNITFYSDVRVADRWRVGDVDGGWEVMLASLGFERGSAFGAGASFLGVMGLVLDGVAEAVDADTDTLTLERLGRAATEYEVATLLNHRSFWLAEHGVVPDTEGAMAKLYASEALQRMTADLLDLLGPDGLRQYGDPGAPAGGEVEHAFRHAAVTTIYGGSSEIMRGIIAARSLGLPRA